MQFLFQPVQKSIITIGNNRKVFSAVGLHEFPNHRLIIVLRNKTAYYQIVFIFFKSLFFQPIDNFLIIICQLTLPCLRTIGNKGRIGIFSLNTFSVIAPMNVFFNINTILDTYTPLFKFASDSKNLNCIKLVTYTNNRISALNQVIRKRIYNDDFEYHVGEILTGYDTCYYKPTGCSIDNSQDYIIDRVKKITHLGLPMYELKLFDGYDYKIVRILSRNLPNDVYESLARDLENARQKGLQTKS